MRACDLFAGAGGFSLGAKAAGVKVVWAANHWQLAVDYHTVNHPETEHVTQDLQQADWRQVPDHDIQLAAPACQGHSPARGKERPHHDVLRSTAWAVIACAEYHRSPFVVVENVPEFREKWVLYPAWIDAMRRMGYAVAPYIINAADHGVPQERERLFLVCTQSKHPIQLKLPRRDHVSINSVIDWNAPGWSPIEGHVPNTVRRMASGRARFGERFVAPYYGNGSGLTGRSIHRPIGTLTTKARWAIADGDRMRMLNVAEAKAAMSFPRDYKLPKSKTTANHMLGNAVCPVVATDLIQAIKAAA